jgi:hypothetical protein
MVAQMATLTQVNQIEAKIDLILAGGGGGGGSTSGFVTDLQCFVDWEFILDSIGSDDSKNCLVFDQTKKPMPFWSTWLPLDFWYPHDLPANVQSIYGSIHIETNHPLKVFARPNQVHSPLPLPLDDESIAATSGLFSTSFFVNGNSGFSFMFSPTGTTPTTYRLVVKVLAYVTA